MQISTVRGAFAVVLALFTSVAACDRGTSGSDSGAAQVGSSSSKSAGRFEGEITAESSGRGGQRKAGTITFSFKGSALRIDGLGDDDPGSLIVDPSQKSWVLMPTKKQAIGVSFADVISIFVSTGAADGTMANFAQTGKKDVVAGRECQEWTVTTAKSRVTACVAESITWLDFGQWPALAADKPESSRAYMTHFPLRYVSYDLQGVETSRLTVTKVDEKPLDDVRFVVPAEYEKTDLAPFLGGLARLLRSAKP
jgi:hypothetical protein